MSWLHFVHPNRIRTVGSLHALVTTSFQDGINAFCWPRTLPGNFGEVLAALPAGEGIVAVEEAQLAGLSLSEAGRVARDLLLADLEGLRAYDLLPELDCVHGRAREAPAGLFHTDVASWHVDTATAPADTVLCTYVGACSQGLPNEEAQRRVDVPETKAELRRRYGGEDDAAGFQEYLADWFYDLHSLPRASNRARLGTCRWTARGFFQPWCSKLGRRVEGGCGPSPRGQRAPLEEPGGAVVGHVAQAGFLLAACRRVVPAAACRAVEARIVGHLDVGRRFGDDGSKEGDHERGASERGRSCGSSLIAAASMVHA